MNRKILFSVPGINEHAVLTMWLLQLMNRYPEKFNDDCKIDSVYGSYNLIWNGGRTVTGLFNSQLIKDNISFYNSKGIKVRYTFTNCKLENSDLKDRAGNQVLLITKENQKIKNDVIVGSDIMRRYLEEKYPNSFNIIISTTMCLKEKEEIDKYSKKYITIPDYSINNKELIKSLSFPNNLEFIANESCIDNCPVRRRHYENLSDYFLKKDVSPASCDFNPKPNLENYFRANTIRSHHISIEMMRDYYVPMGINKFKLIGRGVSSQKLVEGFCEYLVKPEYQDEIRFDLNNFVLTFYKNR